MGENQSRRPTYFLFVNGSEECRAAEQLLGELPGIRLELRHPTASPTPGRLPFLMAPEGSFQSLERIQEYVAAYKAQLELLKREDVGGQTADAVAAFFRAELAFRLSTRPTSAQGT